MLVPLLARLTGRHADVRRLWAYYGDTIEAAIDRDSLEINPLGKRAKDYGSAAVLLSLLLAGGVWLAILAANFLA